MAIAGGFPFGLMTGGNGGSGDAGPVVAPASAMQQQVWFAQQLAPDSPAYNMSAVFHLAGAVDIDALGGAVADVTRRHPALRTRLRSVGARVVQEVLNYVPAPWSCVDLSGGHRAESGTTAQEFVCAGFDLAVPPLWRARLVRLREHEYTLTVVAHHAVCDGLSMRTMLADIGHYYAARTGRGAPPPPPGEATFHGYAALCEQQRGERGFRQRLDSWRTVLNGAPPLTGPPTDHPRPPRQRFIGTTCATAIPPSLFRRTAEAARVERVTPFMFFLTVFAVLLHRVTASTDLVIGTTSAARRSPEYRGVVGPFVSTLPLRLRLPVGGSLRDWLSHVREVLVDCLRNDVASFVDLVRAVNPPRDTSHHPIFQVMFEMQESYAGVLDLPGVVVTVDAHPDRGVSLFDLTLSLVSDPVEPRLVAEYDTGLFGRQRIVHLLDAYLALLRVAVDDPGMDVDRMSPR